jgi:hypothetical protein
MAWNILTKIASMGIGDLATSVGKGIGSVMDRIGFTEKMSEAQKMDYTINLIKATNESDKLDAEDLRSARELAMIQMKTQQASWFVRQMNGALRPFAGWLALIYLTERMWGQLLVQFSNIEWWTIPRDPVIDFCMTGILAFFFGFRQRAKEKAVTNMQ